MLRVIVLRKMKKLYLILLSAFALLNTAVAQELKVKSFGLAINDLTASVETVPDKNGDPCALVKILVVDSIAKLEGSVLKSQRSSPTELWVYMYNGAKEIRIKPTHYKPISIYFPDFGVKGVEGKRTYILDLEGSNLVSMPMLVSSQSAKPMSTPSGTVITIPVKNGISIEMVKVEAGSFDMGATPEMKKPFYGERPVHCVTLTNNYYIGMYEVTQTLWQTVMGSNPSNFKGVNLPVENVSWNDCQDFISKLNSMTGKRFRLPTEAEWEYAARGGNKSRGYQYSGSNTLRDVAWYKGNSGSKTHTVGVKQPNELGIYDIIGNVLEWCQDWYGSYSSSPQTNPLGADSGTYRVCRGGCWRALVGGCRSSNRSYGAPNFRSIVQGFRLALSE